MMRKKRKKMMTDLPRNRAMVASFWMRLMWTMNMRMRTNGKMEQRTS